MKEDPELGYEVVLLHRIQLSVLFAAEDEFVCLVLVVRAKGSAVPLGSPAVGLFDDEAVSLADPDLLARN